MFDWKSIYERFAECHGASTPVQLAKKLNIHHSSVFQWRSGTKPIPWHRMRSIVIRNHISWDWLLEGTNSIKHRGDSLTDDFDWVGISRRFLSLFPDKRQTAIANQLGVAQETVSKWCRGEKHVPWERLKEATVTFNIRWDWLIDGIDS